MNRYALAAIVLSGHVFCVGTLDAGGDRQSPAEAIDVSSHPQLFLDDFLIADTHNVQRVVRQPVRHPANPLITNDRPWEQRMMSVYGTVLYDDQARKYRCWYSASESDAGIPDTPEAPGTAEYYQCYAESEDGLRWIKPNVGSQQFGRHKEHNIVVSDAHGLCVLPIRDPKGPVLRYLGVGGSTLVTSADGIAWQKVASGENNWRRAVGKNDTSSCVIRWKGEYLAFVRFQGQERDVVDPETGQTWRGVMRKVGLSTSSDGVHWTPKQRVLASDEADGYPWSQPYGISVTPYGDVLIGLLPILRLQPQAKNNSYGALEVQLVVSRDGRNWHRVANRAPFMKPTHLENVSGKRPWDMEVYPSTTLLVRDQKVHLYYTGKNLQHGEKRLFPDRSLKSTFGIGLATLPADRFVALRPGDAGSEAMLQTKPLTSAGNELLVNADVAASDLRVELLDSKGAVLEGFAADASRAIRHDPLRYRVRWISDAGKERTLGDAASTSPIVVRLRWRDGDLYAFQAVRD